MRDAPAASVPAEPFTRVVVLAGGVGGAKLAHGMGMLSDVELAVVVNTGDDFELHGLRISPDVDTVMYTLAGLASPDTGWGLRDETWSSLEMLSRYGAPTWFRLGDRDLATHVLRTARLRAGSTPSAITAGLAAALGVRAAILPMTDDPVATAVRTRDGWVPFQDWFVRRRHADDALEVRFDGIDRARPTDAVLDAVAGCDVLAIAPSNPFVSIGTILALPGVFDALLAARAPVVAVSPIVAGAALKGPADRMLAAMGGESSALGVARHYARRYPGLLDAFVIDGLDSEAADGVRALGMEPVIAPAVMRTDQDRATLARLVVDWARRHATVTTRE